MLTSEFWIETMIAPPMGQTLSKVRDGRQPATRSSSMDASEQNFLTLINSQSLQIPRKNWRIGVSTTTRTADWPQDADYASELRWRSQSAIMNKPKNSTPAGDPKIGLSAGQL